MSRFVNYKKRSVSLPPGCKDLIDLLAPRRKRPKATIPLLGFPQLRIHKEQLPTAALAQLEPFVARLLHSRGEFFVLSLSLPGFEFPVTLYRSNAERTTAVVLVPNEAQQAEAIRAFFHSRGLDSLCPGQLAYPLPVEAAAATTLLRELLRSVYGLAKDAGLEVTCVTI